MKKHLGLLGVVTILGVLSHFKLVGQTQAQTSGQQGRIDAFTFLIPYRPDVLDDQFDIGYDGADLIGDDIETIISIAVHRDDTIIYYDEWEDGLESDLTNPTQSTTKIWGDSNPANGTPPNFPADRLNRGDVIVLRNTVVLNDAGLRDPSDLFYDGGDVLTSVGGALAVIATFWAETTSSLYAVANELYPTYWWGTEYVIPVGEDLAGNGPNQRPAFTVVGVHVQAIQDGTVVEVDLDADGVAERTETLNYGQQYTAITGVQTGARLRASAPIAVHLFTANPAAVYESRGYAIAPLSQWTNDYLAPRAADGDFWLYNPDPLTPLSILAQTITNTTVMTVPVKGTVKFPPQGLSGTTGVHFSAPDGRPFYGLSTFDELDAQDWGDALLPTANLTTQMLVGLGLGNNKTPPDGNESPIYVTALSPTTLNVDYNNDGQVDATIPVSPLAEVTITDPDHDLTGAFLFTADGTPFVAVWGQDEQANPAEPSIDVGTSIIPLRSLTLQKTLRFLRDVDCTGTVSPGDTIQFKLQFFNDSVNPISNVVIKDNLPPTVQYIPGTTLLNGVLVADNSSETPFPLDGQGLNVGTLDGSATNSIIFNAIVNEAVTTIVNQASAQSLDRPNLGADLITIVKVVEAPAPRYTLTKRLISPSNGEASPWQIVTFGLSVTNVGPEPIAKLPVQDSFNADHLSFMQADPAPALTSSGVITWSDLTPAIGGMLAPGATVEVSVTFTVNQPKSQSDRLQTVNTMTAVGAETSNGLVLPPCIDTSTLSINSADDDDDDDDSSSDPPQPPPAAPPSSPPAASPTPTAVAGLSPVPTPTAALAVLYLPETGQREEIDLVPDSLAGVGGLIILAGVSLAGLYWRHKGRKI